MINLQSKVFYFGIDELEFLYVKSGKFPELANIDNDNTPDGYIDLKLGENMVTFHYRKFGARGYSRGYSFDTVYQERTVSCFAIMFGDKDASICGFDKVVIYSTFFVLQDLGFKNFRVSDFLEKYFENGQIRRLDIAMDLSIKLPVLLKYFDKISKFHSAIGNDKKYGAFHQTYYTNEIQNSKNRYKLIRIYDKVLDTFVKSKAFLFPHLAKCGGEVRRVELELRSEVCKRIDCTVFELVSKKREGFIEKLFYSNLSTYSTVFSKIDVGLLPYKQREGGKMQKYFLKTGMLPIDYVKQVNGYLNKIFESTGYVGLFTLMLPFRSLEKDVDTYEFGRSPWEVLENLIGYFQYVGLGKSEIRSRLRKILKSL